MPPGTSQRQVKSEKGWVGIAGAWVYGSDGFALEVDATDANAVGKVDGDVKGTPTWVNVGWNVLFIWIGNIIVGVDATIARCTL